MFEKMRCIHPHGIDKATVVVNCGPFNLRYVSFQYLEASFTETKPLPHYKPPPGFPDCCNFHRQVLKEAQDLLKDFPNCCKSHEPLQAQEWFNKNDYQSLPLKLIYTLSHTEYHLLNRIDSQNWYSDTTNYIDYCIKSFGQFPEGFGSPLGLSIYLNSLKRYITQSTYIAKDKALRLIQFIDGPSEDRMKAETPELNILIDTYWKWLRLFPFELSIFSHLKERFEKNVPILKGEKVTNPYLGTWNAQLKTKTELIDFLVLTTEKLLTEINSLVLHQSNSLNSAEKLQLEFIQSSRRLELLEIKSEYVEERHQYIKLLKHWLKGEKRYLKEIEPYIKSQKQNNVGNFDPYFANIKAEIGKLANQENRFWRGLPMAVVIKHFEVFVTTKSKNGRPFLTDEQLFNFLQRGFMGNNEIAKQKFNLSGGEKGRIIKRFYELFELAVSQYGDLNRKFKYIKLITECFDNWDKNSIEAFFKPNKTKESW